MAPAEISRLNKLTIKKQLHVPSRKSSNICLSKSFSVLFELDCGKFIQHLLVFLFGGKASQPLPGELHPSPP